MNNQEKIVQKIKNLTPKEMILTMVRGLRSRHTKIRMNTFGFKDSDGLCFGCAATNTLCELGADPSDLPLEAISGMGFGTGFGGSDYFIDDFEQLVDTLRRGFKDSKGAVFFNDIRATGDLGHLKLTNLEMLESDPLPELDDDYTEEDLQAYERFADMQDVKV